MIGTGEIKIPFNQSAELAVLGAVLSDGVMDAVTIDVPLQPDDFYIYANQEIFKAMLKIDEAGGKLDFVSVSDKLRGVDGADELLKKIAVMAGTSQSVKYHARIVKQNALRRRYIAYAKQITEKASDPQTDIEKIQEDIAGYEWTDTDDTQMTDGAQAAVDAYQSIIDAYERKGKFPGIPTGLKNFDALTGGFCDGELIIIGARPAMGKTMFAQRIAEFAALSQNNHVAFFSLEMSAKEIMNRIFSQRADVKFRSLRFGTLDQEEFQRLGTVCYMPELSNLHICDKPAGLHEIRSHCRRLKHIGQCPRMIVIDYLQIIPMAEKRNGTRNDVISTATRELKMLAKEMNCPVICLSQLSRDSAKRPDKRPQLSDLRESGAIEQDADMVILLHREAYYDDKSSKKNIMEVIVAKARNGKTGTVEVGYQPEYMRIANIEYKNKDDKN